MPVAAVAVYVIAEGFAKLLLLVIVIVFAPAVEEGVYVNEAVGEAVVKLAVVGENAPPLLPSEGVTITVPLIVPPIGVTLTVKLLDATETVPLDGPEREIAVAIGGAALTARDMFEGLTRTAPLVATELLLDIEITTVAAALGVYVNVLDELPEVALKVAGKNVPPAPPSEGVIVTVPINVPVRGRILVEYV